MRFLRSVVGLIGGLTGSLAGIGAIFYACGYLVVRAHLRLLGLSGLFDYRNDQVVQEGARFFLDLGAWFADTFLPTGLVVAIVALAGWGLGTLIARHAGEAVRARVAGWMSWLRAREEGRFWRFAIYAALLWLVLQHAERSVAWVAEPLCVSNLLYSENADRSDCPRADAQTSQVRGWLLTGDLPPLGRRFQMLLWGALWAGVLLLATWQLLVRWSVAAWIRVLLVFPVVALAALYIVYVPVLYGVLMGPSKYPVVRLTLEGGAEGGGTYALLTKNDQEFIVWDRQSRRVLWFPRNRVKQAEVQGVERLFGVKGTRQ
jgi:hypothetical protein